MATYGYKENSAPIESIGKSSKSNKAMEAWAKKIYKAPENPVSRGSKPNACVAIDIGNLLNGSKQV